MSEEKIPEIKFPEISSEILKMAEVDQEMRHRVMANGGIFENKEDEEIDITNTSRMIEIVKEIGWPTVSKVGAEASRMAWLLVQHADHDVNFQKEALELMKAEPFSEVNLKDIAYLEDRVRVNSKLPQIYGTQFYTHDGIFEPRPIENIEIVDELRAKAGLESLEEYKKIMYKKYE